MTENRIPFEGCDVPATSVKDFCERYYKHDRYEGRGPLYTLAVLLCQESALESEGYCLISRHDSVTGKNVVWRGVPGRAFDAVDEAEGQLRHDFHGRY